MASLDDHAIFLEFFKLQTCARRGTARQHKSTALSVQISNELTNLIERLKFEGCAWVAQILNLVMDCPAFSLILERRHAICAISAAFVNEVVVIGEYTVDTAFRHDLLLFWMRTHFHLFTDVTEDNTLVTADYLARALQRVRAPLHNTIRFCKQNTA